MVMPTNWVQNSKGLIRSYPSCAMHMVLAYAPTIDGMVSLSCSVIIVSDVLIVSGCYLGSKYCMVTWVYSGWTLNPSVV